MRRRLLLSTCLIALTAVVVLGVPLAVVGTELLHNRADMRLERRADAAAIRLAAARGRGTPLTPALLAGVLRPGEAVRLAGEPQLLGRPTSAERVEVRSADGGLTLLAPATERDDDVHVVWLTVAGLAIMAVLAAAALALLQARRLARPLELLAHRVDDVGRPAYDAGPLAVRLPEVEQVQLALTAAHERIGRLIRRERQFTANASHQLRTPLTGLRMRLEELRALASGPEASEEADAALRQVDRLVATIEHLETLGRQRDDEPAPVDVSGVLDAHVRDGRWPERFALAGRELEVELRGARTARVRPEALGQLADVLLENALTHGAGPTSLALHPDGSWLRLEVRDTGSSPPAGPAVFERGVGTGSGLGLSVARDLVERAGGELRLGAGPATSFEALLPAAVLSADPQEAASP